MPISSDCTSSEGTQRQQVPNCGSHNETWRSESWGGEGILIGDHQGGGGAATLALASGVQHVVNAGLPPLVEHHKYALQLQSVWVSNTTLCGACKSKWSWENMAGHELEVATALSKSLGVVHTIKVNRLGTPGWYQVQHPLPPPPPHVLHHTCFLFIVPYLCGWKTLWYKVMMSLFLLVVGMNRKDGYGGGGGCMN